LRRHYPYEANKKPGNLDDQPFYDHD